MDKGIDLINLAPEAEWEIWHQDTFDRDSPRQVEIAGQGLVKGLIELWARHLFETVQVSEQSGFIHFNLWLRQEKISVEIVGDWDGQIRLRDWVFRDRQRTNMDYVQTGDQALLSRLAKVHMKLLSQGETSQEILEVARMSEDRDAFIKRLSELE